MRIFSVVRYLVLALFLLAVSAVSSAQISIGISVGFAPPPLPVYEQPLCPGDGYLWTPGYWAWDNNGDEYYWVPGTWVEPPEVGYLWTPAYWGWGDGGYFFHEGYWGQNVGWYGGISYGFGYYGHGYEGGRWDHDRFYYNRSVNNINDRDFHNVYNTTIVNRNENHVSYNGGRGGINERASAQEDSYSRERHTAPVAAQNQHVQEARGNRESRASVNQGKPPIAATQRPGSFNSVGVVPAKDSGGRYEPPANRGANNNAVRPDNNANRPPVTHARDIVPYQKPAPPSTGNPRQDQKYQQQQDKLYNNQNQQLQRLQQKQEQDHQRLTQQRANDARTQQVEQRHQQQTQQLQQQHVQQQQKFQQKVQPQQQQQQSQHQSGGNPNRP